MARRPTGTAAANTHGSASAYCAAVASCAGSPAASTAPNNGVPTVPPSVRARIAVDVPIPMSARSTAFCTARIDVCIAQPMPMPTIAPMPATAATAVSRPTVVSASTPTVMTTPPTIGQAR